MIDANDIPSSQLILYADDGYDSHVVRLLLEEKKLDYYLSRLHSERPEDLTELNQDQIAFLKANVKQGSFAYQQLETYIFTESEQAQNYNKYKENFLADFEEVESTNLIRALNIAGE